MGERRGRWKRNSRRQGQCEKKQQSQMRAVAGVRGCSRDASARGVVRARTRTGEEPITKTLEVVARAARVVACLAPPGLWRDPGPGRGLNFLFP